MRKLLVGVIAAVLLFPAAALAATPEKATGGASFVTGHRFQRQITTETHVSFTAQYDKQGGGKGQVQVMDHDGVSFHGVVDCYDQNGDSAQFSGRITKYSGESISGTPADAGFFVITVTDGGEPQDDRIGVARRASAQGCTARPAPRPVLGGNVQVHK